MSLESIILATKVGFKFDKTVELTLRLVLKMVESFEEHA